MENFSLTIKFKFIFFSIKKITNKGTTNKNSGLEIRIKDKLIKIIKNENEFLLIKFL